MDSSMIGCLFLFCCIIYITMVKDIENLLLVLNIKSSPTGTLYTFQTQLVYEKKFNKMMPRHKMLKYHQNKCIDQIYTFGNADIIRYITTEMKLYN